MDISILENTSDVISRQAAIDALDCINGVEEVLRSLPSVQPKHGKWVWNGDTFDFERLYKCSECNKYALYNSEGKQRLSDFCPHCNADMRYER